MREEREKRGTERQKHKAREGGRSCGAVYGQLSLSLVPSFVH